ncbi:MAG TPA: hypothetical protein VG318_18995 [Actinomycetota bacterium]|nr:hypothetical protein [Actinomycetota bacterium]
MSLYHLKSIAASILLAGAAGTLGGVVYALLADRTILYGIATGVLIAGLATLAGGLLGATEPQEGWMTGRGTGRGQFGRRSIIARIASEHPDIESVSSLELAVWGIAVGGILLTIATFLFEAAR